MNIILNGYTSTYPKVLRNNISKQKYIILSDFKAAKLYIVKYRELVPLDKRLLIGYASQQYDL